MNRITIYILIALVCSPVLSFGDTLTRQSLFKIERSKNANIIQYDVQLGPDGKLHAKEPVVGYWIRLAEQGQAQELSWVQRKFAFGFKATYNKAEDSVVLDMVADLGRLITVIRTDDGYKGTINISGTLAYLDTIYINSSGKGLSVEINYIELFGKDVNNNEDRHERFEP